MSRSHAKKVRNRGARWSSNSADDGANIVRNALVRNARRTLDMDVSEGGLVVNDPAVRKQMRQLAAEDPNAPVRVQMRRANGGPLGNGNVVEATADEPFVIEAIEPVNTGDDPILPVSEDPEEREAVARRMQETAAAQLRGEEPKRRGIPEDRLAAQAKGPTGMLLAPDHICPRCGGDVPVPGRKGQYPGALSRTDNQTEVCSHCGTDEAYEQAAGALTPQSAWPVPPSAPRPSRLPPAGEVPGYHETWQAMRGNARLPRSPLPTPKELPDLRLHLLEKWLPDGAYARNLKTGAHGYAPVTKEEAERIVALDVEYQRHHLAEAGLWWVRDEMVDLVTAATKTTPAELLGREVVFPAGQGSGLMLLGKPYEGTDAFDKGKPTRIDLITWARSLTAQVECITLTMYRYFSFSGGLSRAELEEAVSSGAIYDAQIQRLIRQADGSRAARIEGGAWVYAGRTDWPLTDPVESFETFTDAALQLSDVQKASMVEDRRFFASFCLLVSHKLSQVDMELPARQTVRRMERAGVPEAHEISKVRIVRLRDVKRKAGETDEEHVKRQVAWTHRWVSSGHWGWRWCGPRKPGQRFRRRTFISPSIKGPKELPIVFKETVRVWTR